MAEKHCIATISLSDVVTDIDRNRVEAARNLVNRSIDGHRHNVFGTVCTTMIANGELIAAAFYTVSVAKIATIQTFVVTEKLRRCTLGTTFMAELQKMDMVEWHVNAVNSLVEFYEKCGFKKWSATEHHSTDLIDIEYNNCTYLAYKNPNVQEVIQPIENIAEDMCYLQRCMDGIKSAIAKNAKRKMERTDDIAKNERSLEVCHSKMNEFNNELKKLKTERIAANTTYDSIHMDLENQLANIQNKLDMSKKLFDEKKEEISLKTKEIVHNIDLERKNKMELDQEKDRLASAMEEINKFQEAIDRPISY